MPGDVWLLVARSLHVAGVVVWIGGVAFVTTVLLPALRHLGGGEKRLELFETLENRFAVQARIVTAVTGFSGFFMLNHLEAWPHYRQPQFWWLHLMTFVWAVFTLVLLGFEPWFLHRWFREQALRNGDRVFAWLQWLHWILLGLSLAAVLGGVTGAHFSHDPAVMAPGGP